MSGNNRSGQLGLGDRENRCAFTEVELPGRVTDVACGRAHTLVVVDGEVWAAGNNEYGQLGLFRHVDMSEVFTPVRFGAEVSNVAAFGCHSAAVAGGVLWVSGANHFGELCGEEVREQRAFRRLAFNGEVRGVAGGPWHSAVVVDDDLWVAGNNSWGQLGVAGQSRAGHVLAIRGGVEMVAASANATLAVVSGAVVAAGMNNHEKLGLGFTDTDGFQPVPGPLDVSAIATGGRHSTVITAGQTVCCGYPPSALPGGDLTDGELADSAELFTPKAWFTPPGVAVSSVVCSTDHTLAVDTDGRLWVSGAGDDGQLGCGWGPSSVPALVEVGTPRAVVASELRGDLEIGDAYDLADFGLQHA